MSTMGRSTPTTGPGRTATWVALSRRECREWSCRIDSIRVPEVGVPSQQSSNPCHPTCPAPSSHRDSAEGPFHQAQCRRPDPPSDRTRIRNGHRWWCNPSSSPASKVTSSTLSRSFSKTNLWFSGAAVTASKVGSQVDGSELKWSSDMLFSFCKHMFLRRSLRALRMATRCAGWRDCGLHPR
jgi:hypothetical protein